MELAPEHREEIVAHAREDAPDECCGLIAARDGRSERVYRMTNAAHSPLRFEVDPAEVLEAFEAIDEAGLEVAALYHSHTRTAPYPSQTDITYAKGWGSGTLWIIVGLADGRPDVKTYRIDDGQVIPI
jgi:proteasome lid subunit RPN8/RPN11